MEAKAIVANTRRQAEELRECVANSRTLIDESKMLLAQSRKTQHTPQDHREGRGHPED